MTGKAERMAVRVVLVEDEGWKKLRPLTWLRPAADLVVGAWTVRERWCRATPGGATVLCRPHISALSADRGSGTIDEGGPVLWVRDRWVPDPSWAHEATAAPAIPLVWKMGSLVIAILREGPAPRDLPVGSDSFWDALARGATPASSPPKGILMEELSDLLREGLARFETDLDAIVATTSGADLGDGHGYMPARIRVGQGCRIDRGAVLDARSGAIVIGAGTTIAPFTWVHGPFFCRDGCSLLGGSIGSGTYLGSRCRVRGEVESTTFLGHVNKAHDGFFGHSYVGEWVNVGALTTTSDLKNNYGTVHLEIDGRRIETGQMKVGSFVGDHAKTRIGTLLNTGSVIGIAANVFGEASLFQKWIPDFAWGVGTEGGEYAIDRCLRTAETAMARRGEALTPAYAEAITIAFRESREARRRAFPSLAER